MNDADEHDPEPPARRRRHQPAGAGGAGRGRPLGLASTIVSALGLLASFMVLALLSSEPSQGGSGSFLGPLGDLFEGMAWLTLLLIFGAVALPLGLVGAGLGLASRARKEPRLGLIGLALGLLASLLTVWAVGSVFLGAGS